MTLDQLRVFVAVAERRHVTRAAAALGLTQSAASAAIAALEKRYGARLFDRVGRGIELTDTGERFLPEARAVLKQVASALNVLEEIADPAHGSVAIAASQTIANYWLPRRLAAFQEAFPGVRLDVVIGNTRQVEDAVAEGRADLGLVEGPIRHTELIRRLVDRDRLVLVVAAGHPLPSAKEAGRVDLRSVSWVIREAGSGTRAVLEELALRDGIKVDDLAISLVLPSNEAVREAVEAGAGATIISEHVVAASLGSGRLQSVPIDLPRRDFSLLRHPDRYASSAARTLTERLTDRSRDVLLSHN
ncbi:LysR family transcriptional regulator [Rhodopseudomonas julia]|nr:LysR family transcriptional regulator [Rhodopseudomonas julia]